ncbi:MAG: inorganic phosphate transporter [Alphaproteobacteria bacterium]|nr:inorganic phosphate transporter [Rhizobiaceae bacterium]MBU3960997.1 inorganic phosphate transporter [Alphaproteobacteria bacterium]MBU4048919.1 inorganic phosphate transporter [Alphaproteobacteria bacterium]MBU4091160.1 inorganic phosphate transporter [Alphaproteobacteria bacterium]MBU4155834.1 inorganic phosphate transporter [Alphaproteobacteria bacterium]
MAKSTPKLVKPTLDKDLDKITFVEEATQHVSRTYAPLGIGLIFLILATLFAGLYGMNQPGAIMVVSAAAIGAYMAMNIGANDVTNNVGPAVGSRAMTMTTALIIAAIFETAGAMIAGGDVVSTISKGIVDPAQVGDPTVFSLAMMAALLSSALWVNLATWLGAPVSTTHAVVGGVMGSGIVAAGFGAINWESMVSIAASWVISPLLGGVIAALFLAFIKEFIIYRQDKIGAARRWVPVLNAVMVGSFAAYLALKGLNKVITINLLTALLIGLVCGGLAWLASVPLIRRQAIGLENRNQSLRKLFRLPLIMSAALLSFAHGANDVANAIGPLSAIVHSAQAHEIAAEVQIPLWVMVIGAAGISLGLLLFGPRLIRLVGEQITKLNPMRAFCVALSAALTVIVASWLGLPVSSTHIAVGAVFGVGFFREWYTRNSKRRIAYMRMKADHWEIEEVPERNPDELRRRYLVRRSHFMTIVAAWIITVPASAGLAALLYWVMYLLFL